MENTITISVTMLQELADFNRKEEARYRDFGLVETASWCEGKARAYEMLIETFSQ